MWYSICADNLKQRLECTLPDNRHCFTYKRIKFPVCYRRFFNLLFKHLAHYEMRLREAFYAWESPLSLETEETGKLNQYQV